MSNCVTWPGSDDSFKPNWYVAHVSSRHEKAVAAQLQSRNIEHLLPLYEATHQWKNRPATVKLPLFPGYVFVRIPMSHRLSVLVVPGVAGLVSFGGSPAPVPDSEIAAVRETVDRKLQFEPCPYVGIGSRVLITCGPLQGLEGLVMRSKGKFKLVLSIDLILRSVAVEVDAADVEMHPVWYRAAA